jgi:hypothetical protein
VTQPWTARRRRPRRPRSPKVRADRATELLALYQVSRLDPGFESDGGGILRQTRSHRPQPIDEAGGYVEAFADLGPEIVYEPLALLIGHRDELIQLVVVHTATMGSQAT